MTRRLFLVVAASASLAVAAAPAVAEPDSADPGAGEHEHHQHHVHQNLAGDAPLPGRSVYQLAGAWTDAAGRQQRIDDAFVYRWRLWSLPELTEALREAGFRRAQIWRHTIRQTREGPQGWLRPVRQLVDAPVWVAYAVGLA